MTSRRIKDLKERASRLEESKQYSAFEKEQIIGNFLHQLLYEIQRDIAAWLRE